MSDLDQALADNPAQPESARTVTTPKARCRGRHVWVLRAAALGEPMPTYCRSCGALRDEARAKRGKSARNRGNQFERDVAKRLGVRRVGQYGGADDVKGDWISVQCKVGTYYPERIDGWLRALPADAGQLRAVVIGDAPGTGGRRRTLVVLDFDDFVDWFGLAA
jgi:hypothetical protein